MGNPAHQSAGRWGRLALAALLTAQTILFGLLWSLPHAGEQTDLATFIAAGQAAASGADPYRIDPATAVVLRGVDEPVTFPNLNPPLWLLLFMPLARLDPTALRWGWYGLSLLLYLLALLLLARAEPLAAQPLRLLWALGLAGLWYTLERGNVYAALLLLVIGAWRGLAHGRLVLAGGLIGLLVALKPNLLVWPALLLLAGAGRAGLTALATAGLLSALPALVFGPEIYRSWWETARAFGGVGVPTNATLPALATRLGIPWLGYLLGGLLLAALAAWAWRRRPPATVVGGPALLGGLLAAPVAWAGYTLFLLPLLLGRPWSWPLRLAAGLLVVPTVLISLVADLSRTHLVIVGSLGTWALLLVLGSLAAEAWREHGAAAEPSDEGGDPTPGG